MIGNRNNTKKVLASPTSVCMVGVSNKPNGANQMIAYFFKTRFGFELRICARPCNGEEFQNAVVIMVSGKREAKTICKSENITPWNF